jgi:hypothetical protein
MAKEVFSLRLAATDELIEKMKAYQGNVENVVNEVLWDQGGPLINQAIMQLLPRSGRTWKGKKKAAADAKPFVQRNDNLAVVIKTYGYDYLYFPDDGSTTRKHAGQQHFMFQGAENEQEKIIDLCIARLTEDF